MTSNSVEKPPLSAYFIPLGTPPYKEFNVIIERGYGLRVQFIVDSQYHAKRICTAINTPQRGNPQQPSSSYSDLLRKEKR